MVCLLSTMSSQLHAQQQEDLNSSPVVDAESQFLFINMLEFLGEFETGSGEWISPDILANEAFADLDASGPENRESRGEQPVMSATAEADD